MASINTAVLMGRLTKDPELRKTQSGNSLCRFTLACDKRKTKDDQDPGANFIMCVAWRQQAEFLANYASKGNLIAINGSIETGSYTDRDGRKVYTTEVLVERLQLVESKKQRADYPNAGRSYTMEEAGRNANEGFEDFDTGPAVADVGDDLPF